MALRKSPEAKALAQAARQAEQDGQRRAFDEAAFNASPPGQARLAKAAGLRFFQLVMPIENVDRTWLAKFSHEMTTRVKDTGDIVGAALTTVEDEGWELIEAGYTFRQTGSASRDKFLASGQQIAVTGETLGIYLFKLRSTSR
jgi:hypothetical protein